VTVRPEPPLVRGALERLAHARRVTLLKIAGAVVTVGGLFSLAGVGDTLDGSSNWGEAYGWLAFFAVLGAVAAVVVEARYRMRRRSLQR
jgi:peptidoglycan/LPS O-acetylase OafA/YrhL